MNEARSIAYFSMEIGRDAGMPTYAGGLGVLAGDMIRSAADLKLPLVAVTLLHRKGYFYQLLDANGWQLEEAVECAVDDFLQEPPQRATVTIEGRNVQIRPWKYEVSPASADSISRSTSWTLISRKILGRIEHQPIISIGAIPHQAKNSSKPPFSSKII
jgi:glucan phosphorylase